MTNLKPIENVTITLRVCWANAFVSFNLFYILFLMFHLQNALKENCARFNVSCSANLDMKLSVL